MRQRTALHPWPYSDLKWGMEWKDPREEASYWRERERHSLAKGFPVVAAQHRRKAEAAEEANNGGR